MSSIPETSTPQTSIPETSTPETSTPETSTPETSTPETLWEQQWGRNPAGWQGYADKFARYYADGTDMDGESRFLDMMLPRESRVLDAGCGTGRVAAGLAARGHTAIGVDKDAGLVGIGVDRYPGLPLLVADLAAPLGPVLAAADAPAAFEAIVCPGNVMVYTAPGTGRQVIANLDVVLEAGGRAVFGFATDRDYTVDDLDADAEAVGWVREHRFATWHVDPYDAESDWAVSVFRKPGEARESDGPDGRWAPKR